MSHSSVRLRVHANGDRTLSGYVFTDLRHARAWLRQVFVKPEDYSLESVEVDDTRRCTRCDGSGFHQAVKTIGRLTIEEFLAEETNA